MAILPATAAAARCWQASAHCRIIPIDPSTDSVY